MIHRFLCIRSSAFGSTGVAEKPVVPQAARCVRKQRRNYQYGPEQGQGQRRVEGHDGDQRQLEQDAEAGNLPYMSRVGPKVASEHAKPRNQGQQDTRTWLAGPQK